MTPTETPQAEIDAFMAACGFSKEIINGGVWYDSDLQSFALHEAAFWFSICKQREVVARLDELSSLHRELDREVLTYSEMPIHIRNTVQLHIKKLEKQLYNLAKGATDDTQN